MPLIQRFSTPALDPAQANHALLYGLSHEIEARWPADLRYLENDEAPADDAYADCTYYPPDLKLMQRVSSEDCRRYLRALCTFATEHADLLRHGCFLGDEGVEGVESLSATARTAGAIGGILVVNHGEAVISLHPRFRGQSPEAAFEPGKGAVPTDAPLEPNSVRLYRYRLSS